MQDSSNKPGHRLASVIKMMKSSSKNVFLIVEGDKDSRFYKNFIDKSKCSVHFPNTGSNNKKYAIEALEILDKEDFNIVAIVDSDFLRLEGEEANSNNLFLTDCHDLEAMIIQSDAFDKFLGEYASENKIKDINVRDRILNCGKWIGYLRWINTEEKLGLKFSSLDFKEFIDSKTLEPNLDKLIKEIRTKSQIPGISEKELEKQLKEKVLDKDSKEYELCDVCQGHDLCSILELGMLSLFATKPGKKDKKKSDSPKSDQIEKSLRLAFEQKHFKETQLFNSLQNWEKRNTNFLST